MEMVIHTSFFVQVLISSRLQLIAKYFDFVDVLAKNGPEYWVAVAFFVKHQENNNGYTQQTLATDHCLAWQGIDLIGECVHPEHLQVRSGQKKNGWIG